MLCTTIVVLPKAPETTESLRAGVGTIPLFGKPAFNIEGLLYLISFTILLDVKKV